MATTTLSDVRGTLNSINDALSGAHGAEWLDLLKRLLQGRLISTPFRIWKQDVMIRARTWTEDEIKAQFELCNRGFYYEWVPHSISMLLPLVENVAVDLASVTVSELGFTKPVSINDIVGHAETLGLEVCPPQLGFELLLMGRLILLEDETFYIGMQPVVSGLHGADDPDCIFFVTNHEGKRTLGMNYNASEDAPAFSGSDRFVFIQRRISSGR